ncbi:MAG: ThuA domain-containing protein [Limisphaerales bacterium]
MKTPLKGKLWTGILCLCAALPLVNMAADVPVNDGLIYSLEISEQARLRASISSPALGRFQPVDLLFDSTKGQIITQPAPERRPIFVADDETAFLKFDGKDDLLVCNPGSSSAEAFTIFILAAPKANQGNFSALIGSAAFGQNDYTSGINVDFGPGATAELSVLNVESAGATGFRDLLVPGFFNAAERAFADFHVFTVRTQPGKAGVEFFLDGFKGGDRDREQSKIALQQLVIGGRFYSNDPNQPPYAQGSFDGAIAEVLIYDRALKDDERQAVEQALLAKTVKLQALLNGAKGHALENVKDAPLVQMLVPGFTVEELPLKIRNLNNVRYRHDGKVVALGYDGRVHLLSDTDGDGLEDKSELFWDKQTLRGPIGMEITGKNDPRGDGVFVPSKGKVSFIVDQDRDGVAEEEKIIATGWPEIMQAVGTLGLAIDPKDGSIYFGLGCANFAEAYLIDKGTGQSKYDLGSIHGTIQRLSADFSKQETVCTGVRFTCALAFNEHGDLFATDQEGATWLPNGNPMDELLHIEQGRHYGFPPRHPKHLPNVRDEPAVQEYGPQHQSTVGMVFNLGVNGGPHFGPAHWRGDALVCGESRGKIWRTKLAKTPMGYVAQNHLIASLTMLVVDSCVTPEGDLLVACHSGPPDWGTGPAGEGKLFKIRYRAREIPQPVTAWAAAPDEFRIAFDKELDAADWSATRQAIKIEAGVYVGAGDRFEIIRPGYQVVRDQIATPRRWVEVLGLTMSEDRRTLVIRVPRQIEPVNYAITLPLPKKWKLSGAIQQHESIDVMVTLNGIAGEVNNPGGTAVQAILPHSSLDAARVLTTGSADHERFLDAASSRGAILSMRSAVDVRNPFVPDVQPGAKLDWDMSADKFATTLFDVRSDYHRAPEVTATGSKNLHVISLNVTNPPSAANGLFLAKDDLSYRLLPARAFVPWTQQKIGGETNLLASSRTDVKGNWLNGRKLFAREAGCVTCHQIRGDGTAFGPDLTNLIHRDRESVLKDILQPSATINPDHAGTLVTLRDGTEISGLIRKLTADRLVLAMPAGAEMEFARSDVASMEPMRTSLMPAGVVEQFSPEQLEDLMTFLLTNPLEPAPISRTDPPLPKARTKNEVLRVIGDTASSSAPAPRLQILLCAGPKDHGPDEHDYPLWLERWGTLLRLGDNVSVETAMGFPSEKQLAKADVAVFYNANPGWDAQKAAALDQFHQRGGGVVYIHYGVDGGKDPAGMAERAGLAFTLGSKFRHGNFDLVFTDSVHPITRNFPTLRFTDETYWNMRGDSSRLNVIGTAVEEGSPRPELWTLERDKSRIVGCIPGHYTWTFDDPLFRVLVLRSICWSAKQENVDRLADLAFIGARIAD